MSAPDDDDRPIETFNRFIVCASPGLRQLGPDGEVVTVPLLSIRGLPTLPPRLTHDQALNLAAWLVALVGDRERFDKILDAVERT